MEREDREIIIRLTRIEDQMNRLVSDRDSEKENYRRNFGELAKRLRDLEDWKNAFQGKLIVIGTMGGLVWSLFMAFIFRILKI